MALTPGMSAISMAADNAVTSVTQLGQSLFGHQDFSPEEVLASIPHIDPRLLPRAPMSAENVDVSTLNLLGNAGLKRGKLVTVQSHPELHREWAAMSARAGSPHAPQLIIAESNAVNALTLPTGEIAMTTGLLKVLTFPEVRAVLGHELAHANSDHTKPRVIAMTTFGGAGLLIANAIADRGGIGSFIDNEKPGFMRKVGGWLFGKGGRITSPLGSIFALSLGAFIGSIFANQVSVRPTELDADRKGVMISRDPEAFISALGKLEKMREGSTANNFWEYLKSGYPTMETRIAKIREIAQTMPAEPVEQLVATAPAPAHFSNLPDHQIHAVSHAERVGSPVTPKIAVS